MLPVVEPIHVHGTTVDWVHAVVGQEEIDSWEHKPEPVSADSDVKLSVSLHGGQWLGPGSANWLSHEGDLLFPKSWDVLVNVAVELGSNLLPSDHLDNLRLLLVQRAESWADSLQPHIDIVREGL